MDDAQNHTIIEVYSVDAVMFSLIKHDKRPVTIQREISRKICTIVAARP